MAIVLALLLISGCATGVGSGSASDPSSMRATDGSTPSTAAPAPAGDQPPGHADNNAWKRRGDLTAADRKVADRAGARIRPALERLHAAGEFAPDATKRALLGLGYPKTDIEVLPMHVPSGWSSPQPPVGSVFAVHVGQAACVIGDVRPERVLVEVRGAAAEYGCLEPFSH